MQNLEFKVIGFTKSNEKYNVKMVLVGKTDLLSGTISLSTTKETKFEYGDFIKADIKIKDITDYVTDYQIKDITDYVTGVYVILEKSCLKHWNRIHYRG